MQKTIRITTVQCNLVWEDKSANLLALEALIAPLQGQTDVVVLPEMFTTGFSMKPTQFAETMDGESVKWMRHQAQTLGSALCGSLMIVENEKYYNRFIFITPQGDIKTYDKRHLFSLANEHEHYTAGSARLLINYQGWKICPMVCYDIRFPVWSRNTDHYDILLYVANFPERRIHAWNSLLVARAIENQCYVVGVNRVGLDGNEIYHSGETAVIDYEGQTRYKMAHETAVETHHFEYEKLKDYRQKLNFLNDKDDFMLKYEKKYM